jgi:pyrroline-5-carboxylate reductase
MVQSGATGLFTQSALTSEQRSLVDKIFQAIGYSCWVDREDLIDAVIAVSGSGPAYFFLVLECMQKIAQELGLSEQTAQGLSLHTALGASRMAMESGFSAAELRDQVTSPGGTTQAAINSFQQHGLEDIFRTAMTSAVARAQEMSKDFSS